MIDELRHRDPVLFWIGALMLLLLIVVTLVSIGDTRLILGLNPWIKPMKFLTSTAIFLWTVGWFMPETQPNERLRSLVRWTIGGAMLIEIPLIILQSVRGTTSHFNNASPFDAIVFAVMGVAIMINTIAMIVFLWLIRRDTPSNRAGYLWGIRFGVAIFLLASFQGGVIVANNAHTVGAPDGGAGLPFVNWSTTAGDLRIAHFFGMHAMQTLPVLGFLLDRLSRGGNLFLGLPARTAMFAVSVLWIAIMGAMLMMALRGRPLLAM